MFVTWQDGENPPVKFEFDPDDVTNKEGQEIEKAMGGNAPSFEAWLGLVQIGNMKARAVLIWHLLKRDHPRMPFTDVPDFRRKQLKVEMSVRELTEMRDKMAKTKMADDVRDALEAQFDRDIAEAMERESGVVAGEIVPKHL
jgi:hypothetical protein